MFFYSQNHNHHYCIRMKRRHSFYCLNIVILFVNAVVKIQKFKLLFVKNCQYLKDEKFHTFLFLIENIPKATTQSSLTLISQCCEIVRFWNFIIMNNKYGCDYSKLWFKYSLLDLMFIIGFIIFGWIYLKS